MKKRLAALVGLGLGLFSAPGAEAVVNIQNIGLGARSTGLGNSFVAVADNIDALFANTAGLIQLKKRQVTYTNVSLLLEGVDGEDLGQHLFAYAQPLNPRLAVGVGYERIGSDLLSENGAFFGVAYKARRDLMLGVTGKYLFWDVGSIPNNDPLSNETEGGFGIDLSLLWKTPFRGAKFGVQWRNVNEPNVSCGRSCSPNAVLESSAGDVPMDLHVGISYEVTENSLVSVEWAFRDLTGENVSNRLLIGGETRLVQGLALRVGGSKLFENSNDGDLNAGLGYRWNELLFDYGYNIPLELSETNGTHRFSIGYEF